MSTPDIAIPTDLLPADGRFGCGPSKVPQDAVERLTAAAPDVMGTSHRQAGVKGLVRRVREGMSAFFSLPEGYEVALGNGGASLVWDAAAYQLIDRRSCHAVFGEFSGKFADQLTRFDHLDDPVRAEAPFGQRPDVEAVDGVDAYCLTHCETSTGVQQTPTRPAGAGDALVLVDATSAAGGLDFDPAHTDAYYFSPQKAFGSDGGLWLSLLSPAATERIERLAQQRATPAMLDLQTAVDNSRKDQTLNTPSVATLFLLADQVERLAAAGGLATVAAECAAKADVVYEWAETRDWAQPFVAEPTDRSKVVCTVDLDESISAGDVSAVLRANGILDTEAYRKLGRNQLRIGTFPAVDKSDVEALTACIDHVVDQLT